MSVKKEVAESLFDLLFLHNTSAEKLSRQREMGGLPNPSIAVTQKDIPFEGFGDISLIGRPEAFDPRRSGNPMYSADAYTVRAPSPVQIARPNAYKAFREQFGDFGDVSDPAYRLADLEKKTKLDPHDYNQFISFLNYDPVAVRKFAQDKGLQLPKKDDGSVDYYALSQFKDDNYEEFADWKGGQLQNYFKPEQFFVTNPDYDRYSGRATIKPYTAENVSRWMTRSSGANRESTMTFGAGNIRASTAQPITSLDQARQMRGLLQPSDAVAVTKDTASSLLTDFQDALKDYYKYDTRSFSYFDSVGEMIALSEKKGIDAALREVGFEGVPEALKEEIAEYKDYLRSAPTEYFESKPQRAVQITDFGGAIIPEGTPQGVIDFLLESGLGVEKYSDPQSRVAAREAFRNYMFDAAPYLGAGGVLGLVATPQEAEAKAFNQPLKKPTASDIVDSVFHALDMPMAGLQGIVRSGYGLATGESLLDALAEGVHITQQGPDYGADRLEQYITEKTGDPSLGWMGKMGLLFGAPF
jgi:hypothetical protein